MTRAREAFDRARAAWPILIPLSLAFSVFHAWFGPGLIIGDDQFRFSHDVIASYFPWRSAWDGSVVFGLATADSSPAYPIWAVAGALAWIGADFALIERVVWLWPLFFCLVIAPFAFAYRITRDAWASALASCVFAVNTWTIGLVQRGHIPSLTAYSLMPFAMMAFASLFERRKPANALGFAALFTLQVMYDLRYAYITAMACAIFTVCKAFYASRARARHGEPGRKPSLAERVTPIAWLLAAAAVFNCYWLLPQVFAPTHLPAGYDTLDYYVNASARESLAHAVALFYPFYHYVQGGDPFAVWPVEPAFYVLPALAVLAAFAARKNLWALALLAAAALGACLTSGPNSPAGAFNEFLFLHVPGMKLFRDSSKFTSLVAFGYAGLLALGFARMHEWLRDRYGYAARFVAPIKACALIALYIALVRGAYDPARASNFASTALSADDRAVQAFLDRDAAFSRTLLFPTWRPYIVGTELHPVVSADYLLDYSAADGALGDLFAVPDTLFDRLASPLMPDLLAQADVRYIVVDDDPVHAIYEPYQFGIQRAESVAFFRSRPWLREAAHFGGYTVFELRARLAPRAAYALRSPRIAASPLALAALAGTPDWNPGTAVVLTPPDDPAAVGWAYAADPILQADGVAVQYDIPAPRRVRAWVGARPRPDWRVSMRRARMTHASELRPSGLPSSVLPATPVSVDMIDPSIVAAPYADPSPGVHWFGMTKPVATVDLVNWSDSILRCDVIVPHAFVSDPHLGVQASINGREISVQAPASGSVSSAGPMVIGDATIKPGLNALRLETLPTTSGGHTGFNLFLTDDIAFGAGCQANPLREAAIPQTSPLAASSRATDDGVDAAIATDGRPGYGGASFSLLQGPAVSLAAHPVLTLTYKAPPTPARALLFVQLQRSATGPREQVVRLLSPGSTTASFDLFAIAEDALRRDTGDASEASGYDVTAMRIAVIAPRSPRRTLALGVADAQLAPLVWRYDEGGMTDASSNIQTVAAGPLTVHCALGRSCGADIPVLHGGNAGLLIVWTQSAGIGPIGIRLAFSGGGGGRIKTVDATDRSTYADPSSVPTAWQSDVVHVAHGAAQRWRRYDIDLDDVRAYRLHAATGALLRSIHIQASATSKLGSLTLSDATLVGAGAASAPTGQTLLIGGLSSPIRGWHKDALADRSVGFTDRFTLTKSNGVATVEPVAPFETRTLYLAANPSLNPANAGVVKSFNQLSPAEFTAGVSGAGMLVFDTSYAPGWIAYALRSDDQAPTGVAFIDALRFGERRVPTTDHAAVNAAFNGWRLGADAARVVLLYEPEAVSEWSAMIWLALSAALIAFSAAGSRARP